MTPNLLHDVPDRVRPVLQDFLSGAQVAFGGSLQSIILFGSGAEGRLRPTSDVNLLLVLDQFSAEAAIRLQPQLEMAYATIRLRAMFLLDSEVDAAMQAFAQKFADIRRRRRVLYGPDVFAGRHISPTASPKDALAAVAMAWPAELTYLPAYFSELREQRTPPAPPPHTALGHVMEAISELRIQAELIS